MVETGFCVILVVILRNLSTKMSVDIRILDPRVTDSTYNLRRKNQKPISTIKIGLFCFNKEWTCNA